MKKMFVLVFIVALFATSCIAQHKHVVGNGPQTGVSVSRKQWYALVGNGPQTGVSVSRKQWYAFWGLVPVGFVDTHQLAGNAQNYEIYTRSNAGDFFLNLLTGIVSFTSRTVTVTK